MLSVGKRLRKRAGSSTIELSDGVAGCGEYHESAATWLRNDKPAVRQPGAAPGVGTGVLDDAHAPVGERKAFELIAGEKHNGVARGREERRDRALGAVDRRAREWSTSAHEQLRARSAPARRTPAASRRARARSSASPRTSRTAVPAAANRGAARWCSSAHAAGRVVRPATEHPSGGERHRGERDRRDRKRARALGVVRARAAVARRTAGVPDRERRDEFRRTRKAIGRQLLERAQHRALDRSGHRLALQCERRGSSVSTRATIACTLGPVNGGSPASISYVTAPSA